MKLIAQAPKAQAHKQFALSAYGRQANKWEA